MNMSQSYKKSCIYCNETIEMNDKTGTWKPFNVDGSVHDCRGNQKTTTSQTTKQKVETKKALTLEELEARLKRVESIVIDPRK